MPYCSTWAVCGCPRNSTGCLSARTELADLSVVVEDLMEGYADAVARQPIFNDTTRPDLGDPRKMSTAAYRDLENLPARAIGELFNG